MRNRLRNLLAATATLAFALTACSDASTPTTTEPSTTKPTSATVQVRNIAFEPTTIKIAVGDTVTWTNEDIVRHTVTSGIPGEPDGQFDHPLDAEGAQASVTFDEAGTFTFYCELHHAMTGEIVVASP